MRATLACFGAFLLCWAMQVQASAAAVSQRKIHSQAPERDNAISCLGPESDLICCRNCSSCCQEQGQCNFGEGNSGWGNIGNDNFGDFNIANDTFGDCNMEDESYGIGGPEYMGCPKEAQDHIEKFCAINPYFIKCSMPPLYYGEELLDRLRAVVLRCDSKIPVREATSGFKPSKRRRSSRASMPRIRVPRVSAGQGGDAKDESLNKQNAT